MLTAVKVGALALAAFSLVSASPVQVQQQVTIPVDTVARAKFPKDVGKLVDFLANINRVVNTTIVGMSDEEHYGIGELFVMFPEDGLGDCEDYALTKLGILANGGFPAVANAKLVGVVVKKNGQDFGHAILAIRLPTGAVAYLDNRFKEPMTRDELVAKGYVFFDWRA
jgi:predicted transglutaminase-like cysteine proteinase